MHSFIDMQVGKNFGIMHTSWPAHRRSQDFSKGGSHCVKVRVLTRLSCRLPRRVFDFKKSLKKGLFNYGQDIVMAFSPPVLGCLVKKSLQKGGHGHPRTPPWLRSCGEC